MLNDEDHQYIPANDKKILFYIKQTYFYILIFLKIYDTLSRITNGYFP